MIKYRIFKNSASLYIDGETHSLSSNHPHYEEILNFARNQKKEEILKILNHEEMTSLGLSIVDGNFYYKSLQLPHFFYKKFQKAKSKKEIIPTINTWFNIENKLSSIDKKRFSVIVDSSFIPVEEVANTYFYFANEKKFNSPLFFLVDSQSAITEICSNYSSIQSFVKDKWKNYSNELFKELMTFIAFEDSVSLSILLMYDDFASFSKEELLLLIKECNSKKQRQPFLPHLLKAALSVLNKNQIMKFFPEIIQRRDLLASMLEINQINPNHTFEDFKNLSELQQLIIRDLAKYDGRDFSLNIDLSNSQLFSIDNAVLNQELLITIPKGNFELILWGQELKHCIGGYGKRIAKAQTFCFAIYCFKTRNLLYTIEYNNKKIIQFMGKNNRPVISYCRPHYTLVVEFLKEKGLL